MLRRARGGCALRLEPWCPGGNCRRRGRPASRSPRARRALRGRPAGSFSAGRRVRVLSRNVTVLGPGRKACPAAAGAAELGPCGAQAHRLGPGRARTRRRPASRHRPRSGTRRGRLPPRRDGPFYCERGQVPVAVGVTRGGRVPCHAGRGCRHSRDRGRPPPPGPRPALGFVATPQAPAATHLFSLSFLVSGTSHS